MSHSFQQMETMYIILRTCIPEEIFNITKTQIVKSMSLNATILKQVRQRQ